MEQKGFVGHTRESSSLDGGATGGVWLGSTTSRALGTFRSSCYSEIGQANNLDEIVTTGTD
jgi:hypothetical protein